MSEDVVTQLPNKMYKKQIYTIFNPTEDKEIKSFFQQLNIEYDEKNWNDATNLIDDFVSSNSFKRGVFKLLHQIYLISSCELFFESLEQITLDK